MREATEKTQTPKKAAAKEPEKQAGIVVYIGPDIPGAKQYTTYNNGLPDALKDRVKTQPFFNSLIVPVERLAQASAELAKEGSALSVFFKRAAESRK